MTNKEIAQQILAEVGQSNIANVTHCATRLRLNLNDESVVTLSNLDAIEGVIKAQFSNGQLQVILGGRVENVYKEFVKIIESETKNDTKEEVQEKKKIGFGTLIETISGIFSPILPVLIGCGMIQAISVILKTFHFVEEGSPTYQVFDMIGNLIFYFFPFFLAVSAAKKFKTSQYLAIALAGAFMYPTIMEGAALAAENGPTTISFLGLPILFVNYKSTVFPIILAVWVLSYVYKYVEKIIPNTFKVLLVPLITLFIMVPLSLIILGPSGYYIGQYLSQGVQWLYSGFGFVGAFLLGTFRPVLVMFGMHYAITPIVATELAETGKTLILPAMLAGNLAQAGAAFATGILLKKKEEKSGAFTSAFTAFLGITEPAMYGYNLKYKKPFYVALISAGIASAYMAVFHAFSTGLVLPGILAVPTYHASAFIHIIIGIVISCGGAIIGTFAVGINTNKA